MQHQTEPGSAETMLPEAPMFLLGSDHEGQGRVGTMIGSQGKVFCLPLL